MKTCGIYAIINIVNNKMIIGSSKNIRVRFNHYKAKLNCNNHINPHLQNAWNKYGPDNFEFSIIEECPEDDLLIREDYWMEHYKSRNGLHGYNLKTAERQIPSEETRKKMSEARKGRAPWNKGKTGIYTQETLRKISESNRHRVVSVETRKKMSKSRKGYIISDETRKKLSISNKGRSHFIMRGRHQTEETKRKISEANRGRVFSEEHKKRLSESHIGRIPSKETIQKILLSRKGFKHSKESIEKMRLAKMNNTNWLGRRHTEETKRKISETCKKSKNQNNTVEHL